MNKYKREIKPGVYCDVYEVLRAFDVTCPAMQHSIKKALASGQRGVKDVLQDKQEAIQSIQRSIAIDAEWKKTPLPKELQGLCREDEKEFLS